MKHSKIIIFLALSLALIFTFTGCNSKKTAELNLSTPKNGDTIATIKTSLGDIKILLFPSAAPKAVENFTTHAKNGYYDGIIFHRVMNNFMVQSGSPDGSGSGGDSIWNSNFEDEFSPGALNLRGALSMANIGMENTNTSQFFIVQAPKETITDGLWDSIAGTYPQEVKDLYKQYGGTPWLDNKHTVFGHVIEGLDVVDAIAAVEVDTNDRPTTDVIIQTIEISTFSK